MNSFIRHHLKVKTIKTSFAGIPIKNNLTSQKKGRAIDQSEWRKEYLVLVRNKFALHCTSHDSPSSNSVPLTYPIYLHPRGGGGTPDFKWQGWSNGAQKFKNLKEILNQNLKENPMPNFRAIKISRKNDI